MLSDKAPPNHSRDGMRSRLAIDIPVRAGIVLVAMKNAFHTMACLVALWIGSGLSRAAPPEEPATGKIIVLDNDHTLEGDIERIGSQFRVRRIVGETWVPGERVLKLCADVPAAYAYLRSRANLNDPDEHLRLAEWCRQHKLPAQALAEVEAAVKLRPNHLASRRLLEHLQQLTPQNDVASKPAEDGDSPAVPIDLTADAMGLFTSRVQPILMNTCAGCHASEKGGRFKLTRNYESEGANRKTTQQNLAAVLAQVNLQDPRVSRLLTKAVSVHGSLAQAPLKSRQTPAYRMLEDWVRLTVANNPGLREAAATPPSEVRSSAPPKRDAGFASDSAKPMETASAASPATPEAAAKAAPLDPFDPAIFNHQAHPETQPGSPSKP